MRQPDGNLLTEGSPASFFEGLSEGEIGSVLERLQERRFPAGAIVLAEGDSPREMYIIRSGMADVYVNTRHGDEHRVGRAGPGSTLGEMSAITGQPASATVRAISDLHVLVLSEAEFHRAAARLPQIYRNLGAILSRRLDRANRLSARPGPGRVAALFDEGAPPLLGYALACSVAWHTRAPTLLLVLTEDSPPPDLAALAEPGTGAHARNKPRGARADIMIASPRGHFGAGALANTAEDLQAEYDHLLIVARDPEILAGIAATPVRLVGADGPGHRPAEHGGMRTIRAWVEAPGSARVDRSPILRVPKPGPEDDRAMRDGVLPANTVTGRIVGRAAREVAGLQVGLALGAGSIKGYAHLGVLDVLARAGVPVDFIAGTSIGAAVGALWATGYAAEHAARILDDIGSAAFRPTLPTTSLLSSAGLSARIKHLAGERRFEDLPVPLALVAADIINRQEVVFRRGLLWPAIMASMAIPGIYPPQRMGRYLLVDGGILNPVPGNIVGAMGADIVIAVKLSGRPTPPGAHIESAVTAGRAPSVIQAITRSIEAMQSKIVTETAAAATILIEPEFAGLAGGWGLRHFSEGRRFVPAGARAAEDALPRITAALPWLRA